MSNSLIGLEPFFTPPYVKELTTPDHRTKFLSVKCFTEKCFTEKIQRREFQVAAINKRSRGIESPRRFELAIRTHRAYACDVKLQQGQIWNQGDQYLHILHLERLEVEYKTFENLATRKGEHHHVSKKEFCRLIKHAVLLTPAEIQQARVQTNPEPAPAAKVAPL